MAIVNESHISSKEKETERKERKETESLLLLHSLFPHGKTIRTPNAIVELTYCIIYFYPRPRQISA